jgi:hypothetical protein
MSSHGWWKPKAIPQVHTEPEIEILRPGITPDSCQGVPHVIYQTWGSLELPERMQDAVNSLKQANTGFSHRLIDDAGQRAFLVENFSDDVVAAYDTLVPGAFKADLWRYCVMYLHGGYYIDIKFIPVNGWSFANLTTPSYVLDHSHTFPDAAHGVYNAFLMAKPGCPIMKAAIKGVVKNVKNRVLTEQLSVTGPGLMGSIVSSEECSLYWDKKRIVTRDNHAPLLAQYDGYREDCASGGFVHYSTLWPASIYRQYSYV